MTTPTMTVSPLFVRWIKFTIVDKNGQTHEFDCSVTQAGLTSTGGDPVSLTTLCPDGSFSEATERVWNLAVTAAQDVESADSFMLFLLAHDGEEAEFTYYPKVDKSGTPVGVGFKGTVTITPPDNVGNAAGGTFATFTATLPLKGKYTMIDSSGNVVVTPATGATAGTPGSFTPTGSAVPASLSALQTAAPPVVASPTAAWAGGQYVVLGDHTTATWNGSAWLAGPNVPIKAAVEPSDTFPAEPTITASDATNAAKLAGLGYTALAPAAWTTGQKFTIGTFDFNWSGTAWASGAHA